MNSYNLLYKIIIIGDSNVGKSSLVLRYCDNKFIQNFISTIGIDFKIKTIEIDGMKIKVQIWDTAGQERFRSISKAYYRGSHGIILVYDVTDKQSFNNLKIWINQLNDMKEKPCIVVGNKLDTDKREVTHEDAKKILTGYDYFETSAKNNIGVTEMFEYLIQKVHANNYVVNFTTTIKNPQTQNMNLETTKNAKCCY